MKYKKLLKSITTLMLFLLPFLAFAQTLEPQDDEYYSKAVDFLQGEGVLEGWFIEGFLPLFDDFMTEEYENLILFGQAIAGVAALLYLGNIGFQMLSGDKEWEIMPMLKPFAIGLVIMNWVSFVHIIKKPLNALTNYANIDFNESQAILSGLKVERFKLQQLTIDAIIAEQAKTQAEIEQQEAGNQTLIEEGLDLLGDGITSLLSPIYEYYLRLQISFQLAISQALETIGLWILRICTYLIFFIQLMYSTILIIIGPISIGISVFPMFASSFGTWVARFININLYGFMAFIILKLGTTLQIFAFQAEIDRYSQMVDSAGNVKNLSLLVSFASSGVLSFGLVIICFVISGIGVLCVPSLANMVISSNGNSSAMNQMKRAGMAIVSKGGTLIKGK